MTRTGIYAQRFKSIAPSIIKVLVRERSIVETDCRWLTSKVEFWGTSRLPRVREDRARDLTAEPALRICVAAEAVPISSGRLRASVNGDLPNFWPIGRGPRAIALARDWDCMLKLAPRAAPMSIKELA